jgi:hypothetical protein
MIAGAKVITAMKKIMRMLCCAFRERAAFAFRKA